MAYCSRPISGIKWVRLVISEIITKFQAYLWRGYYVRSYRSTRILRSRLFRQSRYTVCMMAVKTRGSSFWWVPCVSLTAASRRAQSRGTPSRAAHRGNESECFVLLLVTWYCWCVCAVMNSNEMWHINITITTVQTSSYVCLFTSIASSCLV